MISSLNGARSPAQDYSAQGSLLSDNVALGNNASRGTPADFSAGLANAGDGFTQGLQTGPASASEATAPGTQGAAGGTLKLLQELMQVMDQLLAMMQGGQGTNHQNTPAPGASGPSGPSALAGGTPGPRSSRSTTPAPSTSGPDAPTSPGPSPSSSGMPAPNSPSNQAPGQTPSASGSGSGNVPGALSSLAPAIDAASKATGVPKDLLSAVMWDESRGQAGATSTNPGNGKTDGGLMQMNPDTFSALQAKHPELSGKSLSDPSTNVLAGAYLLADEKAKFGSWDAALRAYNSGEGSVNPSNPNVTTTGLGDPNYVQKVDQNKADIDNGTPLPS